LNAAVVLGRCRRRVLIFDTGKGRNIRSHGVHNYLTRDDILPGDFRKLARNELKKYGVMTSDLEIISAKKVSKDSFEVKDEKGIKYRSTKLLIATGLRDNLPAVEGMGNFFGTSVFHCPYCDGWEVKDRKLGVYARNKNGAPLAISLRTWSKEITLYCDGRNYLTEQEKKLLARLGVKVNTQRIACLEGTKGQVRRIVFSNNNTNDCDALFFVNGYHQQAALLTKLGCSMSSKGVAVTNRHQQTNIAGLYVAGDVAKDMHFVVVAAAEGAKAAVSINKELQKENIF